MKTIFHANIDGREIVLGFGESFGLIDPVATALRIAPLLQACDEQRQMNALAAQINGRRQEAGQAFSMAQRALGPAWKPGQPPADPVELQRRNLEYQGKLLEVAELEKQLAPLVAAFEAARARIGDEYAVYAHPPQGEDLIDDVQAADMAGKFALCGYRRALGLDGKYVDDWRGCVHWQRLDGVWKRGEITALGIVPPRDAIIEDQLTDAQRKEIATQTETARVAALTDAERTTEAERVKASALMAAAQMRSELEIAGDMSALTKSQVAYNEAVAEIDAKYGV